MLLPVCRALADVDRHDTGRLSLPTNVLLSSNSNVLLSREPSEFGSYFQIELMFRKRLRLSEFVVMLLVIPY